MKYQIHRDQTSYLELLKEGGEDDKKEGLAGR
jgi:hypothetical protein